MVNITIDEQMLDRIVKELGEGTALKTINRGMARGLLKIHQRLPPYPPPRLFVQVTSRSGRFRKNGRAVQGANNRRWVSSYRRTGTLGKSIGTRTEYKGNDVVGYIGTNVSVKTNSSGYAQFVIGNPQAWMHVGRWWMLSAEIEKRVGLIVDEIDSEMARVLSL